MADKDGNSLLLGEIKGKIDMMMTTMVTLIHPRLSNLETDVKDLQAWKWKAVGAGGMLGAIFGYVMQFAVKKLGG